MNHQQILNTIQKDFEDLKARFEAFEERLKKPEAKPWPQDGDLVYIVDPYAPDGYLERDYSPHLHGHRQALAMDLMYRTEEGAKRRVKHDRLLTEINGANDFVPDWDDWVQEKCHIAYDSQKKRITITSSYWLQNNNRIKPYPTYEAAQAVIDKYGDDLKLLFEVV